MRSECTRKKEHQTISRNQKSNNERPYGHTHHTKREQSITALALHHSILLGFGQEVPW